MTTQTDATSLDPAGDFETGHVLTIISGHFFHDSYTAFVAPLLPLIIDKLSISLTQAGWLTAVMQIPAILNPFIGFLADKISLRYFVIFSPAATATLIGLMGLAPNNSTLVALFFLTGISVALFHAPAPAIVAHVSGKRTGLGMSLFMAAGEFGRTVGPLVAVSAVAAWGLEGIYRLIAIGWGSSLIMLWRFRGVSSKDYRQKPGDLSSALPRMAGLLLPIVIIVLARAFLTASLTTYLPTLLSSEGASLAMAGISLSILEGAGVVGALASGTISDRAGRKPTLLAVFMASALFMFLYLQAAGWWSILMLLLLGFTSLSAQPVLLALVQDHMPENRALANGVFLGLSFLLRSMVLVLLGMAGDAFGLRATFYGSGAIALVAVPAILLLPDHERG